MTSPTESAAEIVDKIVVGEITAVSGLRGEVRVRSFTRPASEILQFSPWFVGPTASNSGNNGARAGWVRTEWAEQETHGPFNVSGGGKQGKHIVARLEGLDSRQDVEKLVGLTIRVATESLPQPGQGEYYWDHLVGLRVINLQGELLGVVDHLLETGANDVLVVDQPAADGDVHDNQAGQRLLPWIESVIIEVDLESGLIKVDWELDY